MGDGTEFSSLQIQVTSATDPVDPEPPEPTEQPESGESKTPLIVGITVPLVLVLIALVVTGYCCFKKHRSRRASFTVKTLSMNSNSFNRPESLIYANTEGVGAARAARYAQQYNTASAADADPSYANLRVNYRAGGGGAQIRGEPRAPTKRTAPPPPGGRTPNRTDIVRNADTGMKYNRDFDAGSYSRNLSPGRTQTSDA